MVVKKEVKEEKRFVLFLIVLLLFLFVYAHCTPDDTSLSERFFGTYQCEEHREHMITIFEDNIMLYLNQTEGAYDKGHYEKIDDHLYRVTSEVLGSQYIKLDNLSFLLTIDEETYEFKKVLNLPCFISSFMSEEMREEFMGNRSSSEI